MSDFDARKWLDDLRGELIEAEREATEAVAGKGGQVDFHDRVHEVVDLAVSQLDRFECLSVIEEAGGEEYVDRGLLNFESLDRLLATMAYGCAEGDLFDDDFIRELQDALNNAMLTPEAAKAVLDRIQEETAGDSTD
ncbi:MAG TPA: hypothetical protein VMG99_08830 [Thermoplasmata archaeon]|nr:hypothetical protein [Thermoplasmata archaeon]